DTHIALDDDRISNRAACFDNDFENCSHVYFFKALEYAKENHMTMLHTGDLLDFLSENNFAFVDKYLADVDYIYAAGNHDFCHWVGEAVEDYAYKWEMIKRSAPHFKSNLYFDSRILGGVNIVTMDDSYYLIGDGQVEMLKAEVAKGYPVVLAMHVPLYTKALAEDEMTRNPCAYVTAAPEEFLVRYPEHRRKQQTPDEATLRAVEYIENEPMIKAVITGHNHCNFEDTLPGLGIPQITTHGSFAGYVREITLI
ncbi:MAG: metallophosphoesterase, partial [Clostridia bacterium]|nr:metallophosphoesterase [Clostridia bacterium]